MKNKAQLDISFAWIFAIIVGAAILGFAIYLAANIINQGQTTIDAKTAKEIGVLLNPLQLGLEDFKSTKMSFASNTRVYNDCNLVGDFGNQKVMVSQMSFGKWTDTGMDYSQPNIYIYSNETMEGSNFNVFAEQFKFPFKVADLIYMIPEGREYCFVNAPSNVNESITRFNLKNLVLNCTSNSIRVCFESSVDCDIQVKYNQGEITKKDGTVYFSDDSLMYAGIFSDKFTYECQLKRLMKKTAILSKLYQDKSTLISRAGCNSNVEADLSSFKTSLIGIKDSSNLFSLSQMAKSIGEKNDANIDCKLW